MKRRIAGALPIAAALALSATAGLGKTVENTSYSTPDGMRVLRHEIVVTASRDEVGLVVPGSADSMAVPPAHRPAPGHADAINILETRPLAYLDADWDGRVFTEPAGRRFTRSALRSVTGRQQYPVDILEVRSVAGIDWLHVAIYAVSPCDERNAAPVHAGWVPAWSEPGQFVVGTWPGGC